MADVRHFENNFIFISQSELSDFDQIWYTDANFHSEDGDKNRNLSNSRWRTDAILKTVFWPYLGAILADLCKFRNGDEDSHGDIGHLTKMAIFANSRWRTAAILKIALSPYLSRNYRFRSNLVCRCKFPFRGWLFDKNRNFSNSRWRTDAILKIVFLAISRSLIGRLTQNSEW